jgi:hypothetical protein
MKKLILSISLLLTLTAANAGTYVASNLAATNTTAVAAPVVVTSLTLYSTNNVPTLTYLYDGSTTVTNAAWTNYTATVGAVVETYIGANGLTNTWTNQQPIIAASPHAAATIARTPVASFVVPANNVPLTLDLGARFTYSVVVSNNLAGLSGIINYRTP